MDIIYTEEHRGHAPAFEFSGKAGDLRTHPDSPARAEAVLGELVKRRLGPVLSPEPVSPGLLRRVHRLDLLDFLEKAYARWERRVGGAVDLIPDCFTVASASAHLPPDPAYQAGRYCFDAQTPITAGTWKAALGAASCAAFGADRLLGGVRHIFAVCRPPGHHAGRDYYGGYCFLNNAAVAAHALKEACRVAILDIDFHHGNGTQELFYGDPGVLYVSIHADPRTAFPYFWGYPEQRGIGKGLGYTLNLPFSRGAAEEEYFDLLDRGLEEILCCGAEALVLSLGLDAYRDDPLGGGCLSEESYGRIGARIAALDIPVLAVLEGGYHPEKIGACAGRLAAGLIAEGAGSETSRPVG